MSALHVLTFCSMRLRQSTSRGDEFADTRLSLQSTIDSGPPVAHGVTFQASSAWTPVFPELGDELFQCVATAVDAWINPP